MRTRSRTQPTSWFYSSCTGHMSWCTSDQQQRRVPQCVYHGPVQEDSLFAPRLSFILPPKTGLCQGESDSSLNHRNQRCPPLSPAGTQAGASARMASLCLVQCQEGMLIILHLHAFMSQFSCGGNIYSFYYLHYNLHQINHKKVILPIFPFLFFSYVNLCAYVYVFCSCLVAFSFTQGSYCL